MSVKLLVIPMIGAALAKGCIRASEKTVPRVAPRVASASLKYYYRQQNAENSMATLDNTYVVQDVQTPKVEPNNKEKILSEVAISICSEDSKMGHQLSTFQDIILEKYRTRKIEKDELLTKEASIESILDGIISKGLSKIEGYTDDDIKNLQKQCNKLLFRQFNKKLAKIKRIEVDASVGASEQTSDSVTFAPPIEEVENAENSGNDY